MDFNLTNENIKAFLKGKRAYIRTKYFVITNGVNWAVVRIEKEDVNGVLRPIKSVEVVSQPEETSFVNCPSLDVLSASRMGLLRESEGMRCVVVKGSSEHISFFTDQSPFELTIVDVAPPSPSKLVSLVEDVLDTHLQDAFVKYEVVEKDINEMLDPSTERAVLFPCNASGLEHPNRFGYLDDTPTMTPRQTESLSLVGCSLSARIFKAVYGREPRLINICPVDLLPDMDLRGPILTKCCKVKEGCELRGDVAVVPWGARASDVAAALKAMIDQRSS